MAVANKTAIVKLPTKAPAVIVSTVLQSSVFDGYKYNRDSCGAYTLCLRMATFWTSQVTVAATYR